MDRLRGSYFIKGEVFSIKKTIIVILVGIVAIVLFDVIRTASNPLTRSEEHVRARLLEQTPLGTSMDDVILFIESKKKWEVRYISHDHGFPPEGPISHKSVGEKSIRVLIGEYNIFEYLYFTTSVTVFYGFDEESELIDIRVWKTTDSL